MGSLGAQRFLACSDAAHDAVIVNLRVNTALRSFDWHMHSDRQRQSTPVFPAFFRRSPVTVADGGMRLGTIAQ